MRVNLRDTRLVAILLGVFLFLAMPSTLGAQAANGQPDYTIRIAGKQNVASGENGTVLKITQTDTSRDILQEVHDLLASKNGAKGGIIKIESGLYQIHKPIKFTIPITLIMDKDTVLKLDYQEKGGVGILTTMAKATIQGGVFDCNKEAQKQSWIHGLVIYTGSEGSLVTGVEARNCSQYGNGIVMRASNSILTNSMSHHNDGDGVYLRSCDYCIVQNSQFNYNKINGIDASDQDGKLYGHNLIFNNTAIGNRDGINLDSTYYASATRNYLDGNWIGVAEYHSTADNLHNSITGNTIKNSPQWGIYEQEYIPAHDPYISDYSTITGNTLTANGHGNVIMTKSSNTVVVNNTFTN